jgi:hypothetical protein
VAQTKLLQHVLFRVRRLVVLLRETAAAVDYRHNLNRVRAKAV